MFSFSIEDYVKAIQEKEAKGKHTSCTMHCPNRINYTSCPDCMTSSPSMQTTSKLGFLRK
jgi:hypothetical protein